MPRRKPAVVLPQPGTSVLRRSARLIALQNRHAQGISSKYLVSGVETPMKFRRQLGREVSKRLAYSCGGSIEAASLKKCPESNISVRRSLRVSRRECSDANKGKSTRCKPASTSSSHMKSNVSSSCTPRRPPRFANGGGFVDCQSSSNGTKSGNSVLGRCNTRSISSEKGKSGDGVKSRERSRSGPRSKTKQMFRDCDDDEEREEEVSVSLTERKRMRIAKPNEEETAVPNADEGKEVEEERSKTKNKVDEGWTKELELALQGAYLAVKPSPNFWKKVSKMVPGKSAQECFDRVNSDLMTPRQSQPRSRARKTNLSPIPQFSLSASKLLKPNSPKTKIRQRKSNLSKKTIRHLLEKQNHMDQGVGFDLFSVLEPSTSSNLLSTPTEKGQRLPKILESPIESPMPCSRFASKVQTSLVSPPVLKQVKNKALHEKYIDHLHIREAKRKAESTRVARKENTRPIDENQKKDSVIAAKDALFFDVQDAIQKLKGLEAENSSGSSEFGYDHGETDDEDESI